MKYFVYIIYSQSIDKYYVGYSHNALERLYCNGNQLTTLDISNNTALGVLICSYNQLTSLDVTNNTALILLWCTGNQLNSMDISNNTSRGLGLGGYFDCFLEIENTPGLGKVCVCRLPFPPEGFLLCADGSCEEILLRNSDCGLRN